MSKEKLLSDIENNLDTFQVHFKKLKKAEYKLHPIDIDLLRRKTLDIYEQLSRLETSLLNTEEELYRTINLPENMPKAEIPEQVSENIIEKEIIPEKEPAPKEEIIEETDEPSEAIIEEPIESMPEKAPVEEIKSKPEATVSKEKETVIEEPKIIEKDPEINDAEEVQFASTETGDSIRSAFDLFTTSAEETIGDKLGSSDDSSIAEKMQKSHVNDLRQAIGINEKFLFINELFNGDMGRYNKVIDELNALTTQHGINSYIIELKVANQWSEENEAFTKLKDLLDRKMS